MSDLIPITAYVTEQTKTRIVKHIKLTNEKLRGRHNTYQSMSHFIQESIESKIEEDRGEVKWNRPSKYVGARETK